MVIFVFRSEICCESWGGWEKPNGKTVYSHKVKTETRNISKISCNGTYWSVSSILNESPASPTYPPNPTSLPLFFFNKTQHTMSVSHPRPIHLSRLPPNSTPNPNLSPWLPLPIRSLYLSQRTRPISFSVFPTRLARSRSGPRSFRRVRTS
jgi:hypothetical protein